jgi:hypothetical protein
MLANYSTLFLVYYQMVSFTAKSLQNLRTTRRCPVLVIGFAAVCPPQEDAFHSRMTNRQNEHDGLILTRFYLFDLHFAFLQIDVFSPPYRKYGVSKREPDYTMYNFELFRRYNLIIYHAAILLAFQVDIG